MSRPLIGITCYVEPARWGVWDTRAVLLPESYVQMVHDAGGRLVHERFGGLGLGEHRADLIGAPS